MIKILKPFFWWTKCNRIKSRFSDFPKTISNFLEHRNYRRFILCRINFLSMSYMFLTCNYFILIHFLLCYFQNQDKWKYNGPMNSSTISAIGGGISMQSSQQQSHQMPPNTIGKPPSLPQMLTPSLHQQMQNQQDRSRQSTVSVFLALVILWFIIRDYFAHLMH